MQIDTGDYFVVTRGFKLGDSFATTLFRQPQETVKEDRYSRDHVGLVYHAVEVCHDVVAAKLVFDARPPSNYRTEVGAVISLHLDELEVMTVTKSYVDSLKKWGPKDDGYSD